MKLVCPYCGYEQEVRDQKFAPYKAEFEQATRLMCNRRVCRGKETPVAPAHIRLVFWFGNWSIERPATLEEYRGIRRARELRHLVLKSKFGK